VLVLKRRVGERVRIELDPQLDRATPVGDLFGTHGIEIVVTEARSTHVKLGIEADPRLLILRDELPAHKSGR